MASVVRVSTRAKRVVHLASRPQRVPDLTDRIAIRTRPEGPPVLHQTWDRLLFLHWQVPTDVLRRLVPAPLSIDQYNGSAWVGITPFTIRDSRLTLVPPLPWARSFHEINVRTYVHLDGVPGVWFFSLDASSAVAVMGARTFFQLPYHQAEIVLESEGRRIHCSSSRKDSEPPATFHATWTPGTDARRAEPGSLEFFWVERYCLYTASERTLYRARVFHDPWPIFDVPLAHHETTLLAVNGLSIPNEKEKARLIAGGPVTTEIWPLEELGTF